ncbi:pseudouridine synthase [Streptococcus suis]|uniref:pseudouridine synthase n=1 Tax=Streptococcus suis TaxID=1307 RepID=UPI0028B19970|nr:16S rRNA pseudouridine(516) synthase [Streptococcus suis]WNN03334.1 16S rRNA pseudouridine(516) synthase [Streptococcus suis]WNN11670.1 16S rRNA pseudouridine(516) synthase [Streptococcus suis]WNO81242.1 16S rRNA pseudouridine(516) synthase [Streptococcus suis]HEL1601318.1 16S rRNA pseudouridine(516) synthase [Streptococcus suis]HEL1605595.1 16S rRNA pseudouridine(516) synthase [Streptococcus suis]
MRLDKCMEAAQIGSRKQVKKLFKAQQIKINGQAAQSLSQIVDPELQEIQVAGRKIELKGSVYYLLNKPAGVVSAVTDQEHQTVIDLISPEDRADGLYPLGRLDRDTEGLVLITNNGPLGYRMLHPSHHVDKVYYVEVNGPLGQDAPTFFASGVTFLDGTRCQPADLTVLEASLDHSRATIKLAEGKFHQVKKMFLAYGVKVTYLKRISFGGFELGDLERGSYRQLSPNEMDHLLTYFD